MSFYVVSTPEVADHLGFTYIDTGSFFFVSGSFVWSYNGKYLQDFKNKNKDIPEYKLHPKHGLIPANSKLFKEYTDKEQKEKLMKQPVKKVFEVGDKCVIRNPNNYEVMEEVKKYFIDKECKIIAKFDLSIPMVVVQLVAPETSDMFGVCVVFREEMCYPVKTEKEKEIEEMMAVVTEVYHEDKINKDIVNLLYSAGYRKVGE